MTRLPIPGSDSNVWGTVLNDFLSVEHNTDGSLKTTGSLAAKADSDAVVAKGELVFNVRDYGATGNGTTDDTASLQAALAAASTVYGQVFLPPGTYIVNGTLPLAGYKCSIIGSGTSTTPGSGTVPAGTVIKAVSQTGPVLDFTGFVWPGDFIASLRFEGFTVQGDNTAGAAKKGIYIPATYTTNGIPLGVAIRGISITRTGGIGLEINDMYLSDIDSVVVTTPVGCVANDVPYVQLSGCNGIRVKGLGLRSSVFGGTADVPASGALRLQATTYQFHDALFIGAWFENLHVGTNNAAIVVQANTIVFSDPQFFDCFRATGATGTSFFRFEPSTVTNSGGNIVRGVIPGRGTDTATTIDYGIELRQDNNRIEGVKGYRGYQVLLTAGIIGTTVMLGGSQSGTSWPGWTDNSGNLTNTLIDTYLGTIQFGASTGNATLSTGGIVQRVGTGSPEATVVGNVGDSFMRTDGNPGATLYSKGGFSGTSTGWHPFETEYLAVVSTPLVVSQTIGFATAPGWKVTLGANIAFTAFTGSRTGGRLTMMITQDATGSRLLTWPAAVKWAGGTAPTLSTAPNAVDVFVFMFDGGFWREVSRALGT